MDLICYDLQPALAPYPHYALRIKNYGNCSVAQKNVIQL